MTGLRFSPYDYQIHADPYPVYARPRDEAPPYRDDEPPDPTADRLTTGGPMPAFPRAELDEMVRRRLAAGMTRRMERSTSAQPGHYPIGAGPATLW